MKANEHWFSKGVIKMVKRILKMQVTMGNGEKRVIFFPVVIDNGQEKLSKKPLPSKRKNNKKNVSCVKRSLLTN